MAIRQLTPCLLFDSDARQWTQLFQLLAGGVRMVLCLGVLFGAAGVAPGAAIQQDAPPPVNAGNGSMSPQGTAASRTVHGAEEQDPMVHRAEQRMSERRNSDRQKALVADTDRLLNLAQELKTEVDKSSKDQLSVDVFKRAEQIEKLARSVKEKMRGY